MGQRMGHSKRSVVEGLVPVGDVRKMYDHGERSFNEYTSIFEKTPVDRADAIANVVELLAVWVEGGRGSCKPEFDVCCACGGKKVWSCPPPPPI